MTLDTTSPRSGTVASVILVALLSVGVAGFALAGSAAAQSGSDFQVSIDSTNSPVHEGNTLRVYATVENTGNSSDTQAITLEVNGSLRDSEEVTLDPGESETVTLTWNTEEGDAGDYTATVSSQDDSDETGVRVQGPAYFRVQIDSKNSPVTENDTFEVEAVIENTGDRTENQEINLTVTGQGEVDNTTLALDPGAKVTRTFEWETDEGDAGAYTATVSSEDDSDNTTVAVKNLPTFNVTVQGTNDPVVEGGTVEVEARVENQDASTDTQPIRLGIDGTVRDTETVALEGGEATTVTLEWDTGTGDGGQYRANVSSETSTDSVDVLVNEAPSAAFTVDPPRPTVNRAVTLDGSGSSDADGEVVDYEWTVDGDVVASEEAFSYTFTEAGDHEVALTVTDDDGGTATTTRTVTVNGPPTVSLGDVDATVGEEVTIQADASDDGTIARYEWSVEGEVVSTGETLSYTFTEPGPHQVTVRVTDEDGATTATTTSVTVEGDATGTPTGNATASPTASPPSADAPGFGAAVALVAVLATALLARRRA
jgi:PGF-CTERM protein